MGKATAVPVTQRAYTLRLRGITSDDQGWRQKLWLTHEAVNHGAKAFGDWLLTLRGGLCHTLADMPVAQGKRRSDRTPTDGERRDRRILLALSWLSVESRGGSPSNVHGLIVAAGDELPTDRNRKVIDAFREILRSRGLNEGDSDAWAEDCAASLSAAIRDDAVWVNRSKAFDLAAKRAGDLLTRDEAWDMLERFLGSPRVYLLSLGGNGDDSEAAAPTEEKAKDLVQKAGQWLSSRFGTGKGADFGSMGRVYAAITEWAESARPGRSGEATTAALAEALAGFGPPSNDSAGVLRLISGPGYKSATRNIIGRIGALQAVTQGDVDGLRESASKDADKCRSSKGTKGQRPYANAVMKDAEAACGFTYLCQDGPARHSEFAVMLDHAARRVSLAHTWIKRAEAERRQFEEDAGKIAAVPVAAKKWLDAFCLRRSDISGASETYRIRRRAVDGWKDVVQAWARCTSEADRIAKVGEVQAECQANDEKFGDCQLFEALAAEDARGVWQVDGKPEPQMLIDYVIAAEAEAKRRRFKVPAYRHPDSLLHPIFCDFGYSRWEISFAAHEAARRLIEARAAVAAATTPQQKKRAEKKLREAEQQAKVAGDAGNGRSLSMGLWTGVDVVDTPLLWQSKRMGHDLVLNRWATKTPTSSMAVTRADRLGRATASVPEGEAVGIIGLFEQEKWNGRLQAPRAQLEAIARVRDDANLPAEARRRRMASMFSRVRWLMTFSAKLQPQGPWTAFAEKNGLRPNPEYWPHAEGNRRRQGLARLGLCRLPGLRVLSVDLGHRYAAACVVWETLSGKQMKAICRAASAPVPSEKDVYLHLRCESREGRPKTALYRRVGPDELEQADTETGEVKSVPHPAPWARLDRQFLIKLQGEETSARAASPAELAVVRALEASVGRQSFEQPSSRVDELMAGTVRTVRLALARHGRRARIAFNLTAAKKLLAGGRQEKLTDEGHVDLLAQTLLEWYSLFTGKGWSDDWAKAQWEAHVVALLKGTVLPKPPEEADATRQARNKYESELRDSLASAAKALAKSASLRQKLHDLWVAQWHGDDAAWRQHLRQLRDWILPRGKGRERVGHGTIRRVGGLSLTRIATIKSLYQVQKAFHMRPEPEDLRKNIPARGDDDLRDFGRSVLDAMERMREQRVKQLASRIAEAALGIGRMKRVKGSRKDSKRPRERVDEPCHAVVIENLTHYRPEETRTRRENRQLMSWSSSKVKKYLAEACQLHGLHLREVPASYTSRQDSRTGAPGVRCQDVPIKEFMQSPFWRKQVAQAEKKLRERKGDERERLLCALNTKWNRKTDAEWQVAGPARIPLKSGELFVSSDPASPAARGLQADLNAAANIGLRALLDPDWPGRWWYVPCDPKDHRPASDKVKGCTAFDSAVPLPTDAALGGSADAGHGKKKGKAAPQQIVNLWRDVTPRPVTEGHWRKYDEYWKAVTAQVIKNLQTLADK